MFSFKVEYMNKHQKSRKVTEKVERLEHLVSFRRESGKRVYNLIKSLQKENCTNFADRSLSMVILKNKMMNQLKILYNEKEQ